MLFNVFTKTHILLCHNFVVLFSVLITGVQYNGFRFHFFMVFNAVKYYSWKESKKINHSSNGVPGIKGEASPLL